MTTDNHFAEPVRERTIYSVSRLNHEVRAMLEGSYAQIWVEGEISNLARPASGHVYFSLKDQSSQIRCALFKSHAKQLGFALDNGTLVVARARVSLYEARGDYQLIVSQMEPAGEGALRLAFEQLKQTLDKQGLFAAERKRALPNFPTQLGVVTSPSGAALRDVLSVLKRRFPVLPVVVYPVPVQGGHAPAAIAAMLQTATKRQECDLLILTRGGGSLEDLWAFNDERVARAIDACEIPIISAIGHQIDFTIADFVADLRAPTPSVGAELASPDQLEILDTVNTGRRRLVAATVTGLKQLQRSVRFIDRRLVPPGRRLQELAQRLDDWRHQLDIVVRGVMMRQRGTLATLTARLKGLDPRSRIALMVGELDALERRLFEARRSTHKAYANQLELLARALEAVSPQATLARGYAIVRGQGGILRHAADTAPGAKIVAQLSQGSLELTVTAISQPDPD